MVELALVISIIALIGSYVAYSKSGAAAEDLKRTVEDIGLRTETLRNKTADMLEKIEKKIRGVGGESGFHSDTEAHTQHNAKV